MIISETKDMDLIESILYSDEMYNRVRVDGIDKQPLPTSARYFCGTSKGEVVGVIILKEAKVNMCHINVVKRHRAKYAGVFAKKFLREFGDRTLFTAIPTCFPDVIRFASAFGFELVKIAKSSVQRDGVKYSNLIMRRTPSGLC